MAGPTRIRPGCGQAMSPAEKPAGSTQSICGGSPESPGLIQYVCHPGAIVWRSPIQNVLPGARASRSLTSSTVTLGLPVHATPAPAGAAARPAARSAIIRSRLRGLIVPIAARRPPRLPPQRKLAPSCRAGYSDQRPSSEDRHMDDLLFNPMDPAFVADPYPTYRRLRAEDPVHQSPLGFWILTRYEDVATALRDPRLAKEAIASFVAARFGLAVPALGMSMLDRDPPDHTRLRGLVSKAFTPRVVDVLRPHIQQIVDGLLARAENQGGMDLIEDFAYPLPVTVICEMLGVPLEDRERFKTWGLDIARGLDAIWLPPDSDVTKRSFAARHELADYF